MTSSRKAAVVPTFAPTVDREHRPARRSVVWNVGIAATVLVLVGLAVVDIHTQLPHVAGGTYALLLSCQLANALILAVHCLPVVRPVRDRIWPASLSVQAVLTLLPVSIGLYYGGQPGFFIASCLLLLPRRYAWTVVVAIEVATLWAPERAGGYTTIYHLIANLTSALTVWGVVSAEEVIRELLVSRRQAIAAVRERERVRLMRDLHDLLGYSLSATTLKAELAMRTASLDPQRAAAELTDVVRLAEEAASDIRAVTMGDRIPSLEGQLESARAVLTAAGVETRFDIAPVGASAVVDAVLATVVREGVTNLLRHSATRLCTIALHEDECSITLMISNDGRPFADRSGPAGGHANLQSRLSTVGGQLHAGRVGDSYVLRAVVGTA